MNTEVSEPCWWAGLVGLGTLLVGVLAPLLGGMLR